MLSRQNVNDGKFKTVVSSHPSPPPGWNSLLANDERKGFRCCVSSTPAVPRVSRRLRFPAGWPRSFGDEVIPIHSVHISSLNRHSTQGFLGKTRGANNDDHILHLHAPLPRHSQPPSSPEYWLGTAAPRAGRDAHVLAGPGPEIATGRAADQLCAGAPPAATKAESPPPGPEPSHAARSPPPGFPRGCPEVPATRSLRPGCRGGPGAPPASGER